MKILRIYETNLATGEQSSKPAGTHIVLEPDELIASGQHIVKATHREDVAELAERRRQARRRTATTSTFEGAGFGTLMVRLAAGPKDTPPVASSRAYLRGGLPGRLPGGRLRDALHRRRSRALLDPIVAVLDALPAHFDPDLAPRDMLDLLAAWLGVDLDESQELKHQREMVRRAAELGRRAGRSRASSWRSSCPSRACPLRVEDQGGVTWSLDRPRRPRKRRRRRSSSTATSRCAEDDAGGDRPLHRAVEAGSTRPTACA